MTDAIEAFASRLKQLGIRFEAGATSPYCMDASFLTLGRPGLVVFPMDEAQVLAVVDYAVKHRLGLTPRAKGSGTAGAAIAPEGGIIVVTDRLGAVNKFGKRLGMPRIGLVAGGTEVEPAALKDHARAAVYARAGAGVTTDDLDRFLAGHGWQCAVVPSSGWSTIAGNFSTNAGGNGTPKYGTFDNIVGRLRVVVTRPEGAAAVEVLDKAKIMALGGGQGLYGIITELDVLIVPRIPKEELFSCVCACGTRDVEALGDIVGGFMCEMQEATKPVIAEFMMADKNLFKKDDPLLKNPELAELFAYPDGTYKFLTMYQGRRAEMAGLKELAARHAGIEYREITAELFKVMLDLRKASTGKSPGRVAIPGFEDIYVKDPRFLGKVLKAVYAMTEGSGLPGRPVGHQYTGGLVIHYRPLASAARGDYGAAFDLTQKLCAEVCTEKYRTIKRKEHGLGLEVYKYAGPEERARIVALKCEYDPAGVFQAHLLTETPDIRFIGPRLAGLG